MRKKPKHHLQLRVRELGQLFNSMDPTPFLNKDLDREAEAFIETWAAEFSSDSRLRITIHLEHLPAEGDPSAIMIEAIHNYFDHKADLTRSELKHLLRDGRISLVIGIAFVTPLPDCSGCHWPTWHWHCRRHSARKPNDRWLGGNLATATDFSI